jgi:DNA polymerase-1
LFVWPSWAVQDGSFCWSETGEEMLANALLRAGWKGDGRTDGLRHTVLIERIIEQGAKPPKEAISAGMQKVWRQVEQERPDVIVPVGSSVFNAIAPEARLIDWGGRDISRSLLRMEGLFTMSYPTIIPIFHPDHVATHALRRRELDTQIAEIVRAATQHTRAQESGKPRRKFAVQWDLVRDPADCKRRLDALTDTTAFDYETTGLSPHAPGARIRCVGFCCKPGEAFTVDLECEHKDELFALVKAWLLSPVRKVCHNAKFEIKWSRVHFKVHPRAVFDDTMLLHHVMFEESSHRLELLAQQHTSIGGYDDELKRLKAMGVGYDQFEMSTLAHYCCGDVDATQRVFRDLLSQLAADPDHEGLEHYYRNSMIESCHVLAKLELDGMFFDVAESVLVEQKIREEIRRRSDDLDRFKDVQKAKLELGLTKFDRINANSPPQVATLLYDVMRLPGERSTEKDILEDHERHNRGGKVLPMVRAIRTALSDIKSLDELREYLRPDFYINSNFRQDVAVTFRLSSTEPNLQNQRVNGPVRRCFRSRFPGGWIGQGDFSQLEVRLFGSLAEEQGFIEAFRQGWDIHMAAAVKIFKKPMGEITKEERNAGKRVNFGVIFGIGAKKLAAEVGCSFNAAEHMLEEFDAQFSGISKWKTKSLAMARKELRVRNKLGLVRRLPDINHTDNQTRWRAERQAINFQIQSLGAGLTLLCMNAVSAEFFKAGLRSVLIGQIHDSLIADIHPEELEQALGIMHSVMEVELNRRFPFLLVPLHVDFTYGPSWLEENHKWEAPKQGPRRKAKAS